MRFSLLFLPVCAVAVFAGSLPYAYGGVINAPDAYVLEHTEVEVGIAATAFSFEDSLGAADSDVKLTGYLNFGILSYGDIGAAYLAGLAVNYWENLEAIRQNFLIEQTFESTMTSEKRDALKDLWEKAIRQTRS